MSTKFLMIRDINGYNGFGLVTAENKKNMILQQNVEQNFTVPANASSWLAIFSYQPGSTVWVAFDDTASLPDGDVADTTSELNPAGRYVKGGSTISLITSDGNSDQVGVSLYVLDA